MSSLPSDAVPAAEFIVRHMHRTIALADGISFSAIPETANPVGGDTWFWTDDNAKVLSFLSRPELWERFPEQTAEILRFVRAMCRPPFIFRRLSPPLFVPVEDGGPLASYRHSLMNIRCDLSRGIVVAGMRFHDERNLDNILLTGNRVDFVYRGRRYTVPVEDAITDTGAGHEGHVLTLWHAGDLHFTLQSRPLRLGRITYRYGFDDRSMLIDVEARLDLDSGIEVSDVVLTIAHDQLGQWYYSLIDVDSRQTAEPLFISTKAQQVALDVAGASYYVIRQGHFSGEALALHSTPYGPGRLTKIEAIGEAANKLHRAIAQYSFPGSQRGATLVAAEQKLLTGGGFYERVSDYAGFMQEAIAAKSTQQAAYDFSISYDYGVVIDAFAKSLAACNCVSHLAAAHPLRSELHSLIDTYIGNYLDVAIAGHRQGKNTIFSRELSFVILGAVTAHRATGATEYLSHIRQLCEGLLDLELQYTDAGGDPASGFLMRNDAPPIAHVDCHSAALLGLVQAASLLPDPRLIAAIDRGLGAYVLESDAIAFGNPARYDGVGTLLIDPSGARRSDPAFWNFKAGLTLRLFAALRSAPDPTLQRLAARHSDRIDLFDEVLRRQLAQAMTWHDGAVEFRTSVMSGETNSETQPWVMLGLVGHPAD